MGEGKSKENVDEGSPGANATKEKAFVGLWNPGSRRLENQTAAGVYRQSTTIMSLGVAGVPAEVGRGKTPGLRLPRWGEGFLPL